MVKSLDIDPLTGDCVGTYPEDPYGMTQNFKLQRVPKPGDIIESICYICKDIIEIIFTNGIHIEAVIKN